MTEQTRQTEAEGTRFIFIRPRGKEGEEIYLLRGSTELAKLQEMVGGNIEAVSFPDLHVHMYADEEGALKGRGVNLTASLLSIAWGSKTLIRGPVVILGDGPDGEEASLGDTFCDDVIGFIQALPSILKEIGSSVHAAVCTTVCVEDRPEPTAPAGPPAPGGEA